MHACLQHRFATSVLLCLLAPLAAAAGTGPDRPDAQAPAGPTRQHAHDREDCPPRAPPRPGGALLPDPFARADGSRIRSRAEWRCQRRHILQTAHEQVYGARGPAPDAVGGNVTSERIDVHVAHAGREVGFSARVRLPPGPGPHPAMIVVGGIAGVDDRLLAELGIARIDFVPTQVGAETGTSRARQGAFFDLYGEQVQATGTLMAWAWGVSRIIDVIAGPGQHLLRPDAIGVTGCSRLGKGALAAGAFDQRVALTIPIESGAGGVAVWRDVGAEGAQPAHSAYGEQPWLGDAFREHAGAVERLAIDQHQVLGLVAPRGLLVLDNPHVAWLGARAGHVSALAGAQVYRALGAAGNLGYHSAVEDATHCRWRPEWDAPARAAITRHLLHGEAPDLSITAADQARGDLEDHRDWETPVLD